MIFGEINLTRSELSPKLRMGVKVEKKEDNILYVTDGNLCAFLILDVAAKDNGLQKRNI